MTRRQSSDKKALKMQESTLSVPEIHLTQQIIRVETKRGLSDCWLFGIEIDVDATNKRWNFKPGIVVKLGPSQFPIRT